QEDSLVFQPEVVVQVAGEVLLHAKHPRRGFAPAFGGGASRFRCVREVALCAVSFQSAAALCWHRPTEHTGRCTTGKRLNFRGWAGSLRRFWPLIGAERRSGESFLVVEIALGIIGPGISGSRRLG